MSAPGFKAGGTAQYREFTQFHECWYGGRVGGGQRRQRGQAGAPGVSVGNRGNGPAALGLTGQWYRGEGQGEAAAGTGHAVQADLTAHLVRQLTADRQPQATPLGRVAVGALVGLGKDGEDLFLIRVRDAGSGIRHGESQVHLSGGAVAWIGAGRQPDFAIGGELDRITEQVTQYLLQSAPVDADTGRQFGRKFQVQLQLFVRGQWGQVTETVPQQDVQVGRLYVEAEVSTLHTAEVQDIIDQGQQMTAIALDGGE